MKRACVVAALLAVSGCRQSLREYEVGELEEERVQQAVKAIAAGIENRDSARCVSKFAPGYRDAAFDSGTYVETRSADGVTTSVWSPGRAQEADAAALEGWFGAYIAGWSVTSRALAKIREIRFDDEKGTARGRFYLDVYGISAGGEAREDHLYIETEFEKREDSWLITRLRFDRPTYGTRGARAQFRDVSRETNAQWPHQDHPQARGFLPIPEQTADCGLACGDYDGDGWYDVYLCNGRRNTLLRNRGDGTFEDVTDRAGVGLENDESRAAVIADFDNDGHPDLYVANNASPNRLFRNRGDGTFVDVTAGSGVGFSGWSTTVACADYDRDGLIDIYQCCYGNFYEFFPTPPEYNGQPNLLFHNLGGMKFEDVSDEADVDDTGWTLAATWGDSNSDGWPDLLVANDFGDKCLFINDGEGEFDNVAKKAGVLDRNFGMSAAFGDIDNDGDFDIYYSNMYSNTNWIFDNPRLLPVPWFLGWLRNMILATLEEMTRGNSLFLNNGDGTYSNITVEAGVDYGQWAWSSDFVDYDADGDLDIYCMNGFLSGPDSEDL